MESLWIKTTKNNEIFEQLNDTKKVDVCVIGGGLFGLTTAYYLTKNNINTIVLEKGRIGEKVSGNTTGKITSQHDLFYAYLVDDYGYDYAQKYLEANEQAIENIKKIVNDEQIDCDFSEEKSYVYTTVEDEVPEIEKEVEVVNKLGKNAKLVSNIDLPMKIKAAIEFDGQAQFHPRKYMLGLANVISKQNKIYENTTVVDVEKDKEGYKISTDTGNDVYAKHVVIATHFPIVNAPGFYFTKMYQSTSYLIAIETKSKLPKGMYINVKEPTYSFRTALYDGKEILLIGGVGNKTGEPITNEFHYNELKKKAKELYPDCRVLFKWDTRDCISLDKIPYIGEFSNLMKNIYVGTGFKKWGMTFSNVAATIVTDKILGKENKLSDVFSATRVKPIKNRWEVQNMLKQTVNSIAFNKFKIEPYSIDQIESDNAAILEINGENVGVYKDITGKIYAVKPNCSHLGCLLSWNNADKTWDCPCHGSRFDYMGRNIYEPAIKDLEIKEI